MGEPLLQRRASRRAVADDVVDVEMLFMEQRRRLVNLATAITLDRSLAEEVVQEVSLGCSDAPAKWPTRLRICIGPW